MQPTATADENETEFMVGENGVTQNSVDSGAKEEIAISPLPSEDAASEKSVSLLDTLNVCISPDTQEGELNTEVQKMTDSREYRLIDHNLFPGVNTHSDIEVSNRCTNINAKFSFNFT